MKRQVDEFTASAGASIRLGATTVMSHWRLAVPAESSRAEFARSDNTAGVHTSRHSEILYHTVSVLSQLG